MKLNGNFGYDLINVLNIFLFYFFLSLLYLLYMHTVCIHTVVSSRVI